MGQLGFTSIGPLSVPIWVDAPPPEEEKQVTPEAHFEKLYTDENALNEATQDPAFQQAAKYSLDPKALRYEALNQAYLSTFANRDLSDSEYPLVRDKYSEETFGKKADTDQEFYSQVQGQFITEQKRRQAATDLYSNSVKQALEDQINGTSTSTVEKFQKWRDTNKEIIPPDQELGFFTHGRSIVQQAKEDIRSVAPQAAKVWQSLTKFDSGEASEEDVRVLGNELASMPYDARQKVYKYAVLAAQATTGNTTPLEQAAKNLGQSISRGFGFLEGGMGVVQMGGILPMSIPTVPNIPLSVIEQQQRVRVMQLERQPDSPAKTEEMARVNQTLTQIQVVRELKDVAKTGIDPVKPIFPEGKFLSKGTLERGIYGAGGSLGYMAATAVNPMLGVAAIYDTEYDQMRLDNPDMNPHAAAAAALASSVLQTGVEMLQIRGLQGLPVTSALLKDLKPGIVRAAASVGLVTAEQNVEEAVQDAISAGIPTVMAALRQDMPDKDPEKVFKEYLRQRGEVFFAVLPLGLIGGGFASVHDFKNDGGSVVNDRSLTYFGFSPEQRARILSSEDPGAALRAETPMRTKENIKDGIGLIKADLDAARSAQENPDLPTLESTILPDGTREWHVVRPAPSQTSIPYLAPEEMKGKDVTISTRDSATGEVQQVTLSAEAGQAMVKRNIDAYTMLIDCLIK